LAQLLTPKGAGRAIARDTSRAVAGPRPPARLLGRPWITF